MIERLPPDLLDRLQSNPFRRSNNYVWWNGHRVLAETLCKRCGVALTVLGADPRIPPRIREVMDCNVRTVIHEFLSTRLRTAEFDTIEFEVCQPAPEVVLEEGVTRDEVPDQYGVHRTDICRACKAYLLDGKGDLVEVQQLYDADLERMAIDDDVNLRPWQATLSVLTLLAARTVTKVLG